MKDTYSNREGVGKKPTPKPAKKQVKKKTKVRFIKNPIGRFRLAYMVGSDVYLEDFDKELADKLVEEQYVVTI